jgi:adenylate cyclase
MFTDMVGFTALGQRNETLSLELLEEQRAMLRPIFQRHGGKEVKTLGDGFLVEFTNALEAVRCAYEIQRMGREANYSRPSERQVLLRVGVHLGDVVETGGDMSGDAVNVASRIESLAESEGARSMTWAVGCIVSPRWGGEDPRIPVRPGSSVAAPSRKG